MSEKKLITHNESEEKSTEKFRTEVPEPAGGFNIHRTAMDLEPEVPPPPPSSTIASPNATVSLVEKPEKVVTQPPTEPAVNEEEMSMPSYATSDAVSQRTSVRVEPIINSAVTKEPEEIAVGMTIAPAEISTSSPLESSSSGWPTWLTVLLIIAGVLLLLGCVYCIVAACYRRSKRMEPPHFAGRVKEG